jgi:hypothetical protein
MRNAVFAAAAIAILATPALAARTPEEAWKAGIADQNKDYAQIPHAMLKIEGSAYLHDGDTAVLQGDIGKPESFRWNHDPKAQGFLTVSVKGGHAIASKDGKAIDEATLQKSVPIDADIDVAGHPTQVDAGVMGWRIFIYNQKNPDARNFKGVSYFPYDASYRVTATFKSDPKLPSRVFRTSRGTDKQFYHAGDATFVLQSKTITLPFYADSNKPEAITDLSAFYIDDLTGKGAYGAGRYVDISDFGKFPPQTATIDFNDAYNPNCARSAHFTCPVAIDAIPLAMTVGEKDPHLAH